MSTNVVGSLTWCSVVKNVCVVGACVGGVVGLMVIGNSVGGIVVTSPAGF